MRPIILLCTTLIVIVLAVYMQVGNHEFVIYDDYTYITDNPHVATGITGKNIIWAFTSVHASNWHPLTWLSHMADVQLYGMNPRGHHLTNVAIHTVSAVLLLLLLFRLTGAPWQSAFVAFMFALHPLHVESVAWAAERKDVLSAFFWFLTLFLYAGYVAKRRPMLYLFSLLSFALGLMSKPMLVTLPVVMLLMDFWPLGRFQYGELRQPLGRAATLLKEKIPFLACSLLSGLVTVYAQHQGGSIADLTVVPFWLRIENALLAYVQYIAKTVWPRDLAVFYPYPYSVPFWQVIGSLFLLLLLSATAIRFRWRHPYLAVGWFWFLVTLVPVIGLVQVGVQSMADRYSYIPLTGLFIMAAWGIPELTRGLPYRRGILALLAGAVMTASTALTWRQLGYWKDDIALFRHTLQITAGNALIHNNLGVTLYKKGNLDAAIQEYRAALRIRPIYAQAHNNLGNVLVDKGDLDAAIQEYREALRLYPKYADAHNYLGNALFDKGGLDAAIQEYKEALDINPGYADAHNNLGNAFFDKGDLDVAIREFREALRINPKDEMARNNLRLALARKSMQHGTENAAIKPLRR
jgi:tetratricopeptide (TPR) repeat protein